MPFYSVPFLSRWCHQASKSKPQKPRGHHGHIPLSHSVHIIYHVFLFLIARCSLSLDISSTLSQHLLEPSLWLLIGWFAAAPPSHSTQAISTLLTRVTFTKCNSYLYLPFLKWKLVPSSFFNLLSHLWHPPNFY